MLLNCGVDKTLEIPLDFKEIKPVNPKGNQSWICIGRTNAEAETPILWPPDVKNWLIGKDPDAGQDWRQEEKGKTEDEMVGWHPWLNAHEFEQAPEVGDGQGSLLCCSPWGRKELTWLSGWAELKDISFAVVVCFLKLQCLDSDSTGLHNLLVLWNENSACYSFQDRI